MRDAFITHVYCGIETPEPAALRALRKAQNLRLPILEAIDILNRYGIEVAAGIILGLDTDTPETPQAIRDFVEAAQVPIVTPNLLVALPRTALWRRLAQAGRLNSGAGRDSNIEFLQPYVAVAATWRRVIREAYAPDRIYARYATQAERTYPNRRRPAAPIRQLTWRNLRRALEVLGRIAWRVGVRSNYRREFWRMAWTQLRQGNVETVFQVAMIAHHLITFGRECARGEVEAVADAVHEVAYGRRARAAGRRRIGLGLLSGGQEASFEKQGVEAVLAQHPHRLRRPGTGGGRAR